MRRRAWLAAMVLAAGLPARGGESWTFENPAPGWTRLAADSRVIADSQFHGAWKVEDPDGRLLDVSMLSPQVGRHEASVVRLDRDARFYRLVLDLGPVPVRHRALVATLSRPGSVGDVLVEGGDDGTTWRALGRGGLVRLGRDPRMSRDRIPWPPDSARFLRLSWPRAATLLEFSHLEVEAVRDPERALPVAARVAPLPGGRPEGWLAVLPAVLPVEALEFGSGLRGDAWELSVWGEHGWTGAGWRRGGPADRRRIVIGSDEQQNPIRTRVLRVDVGGPSGPPAGIEATARIEPSWLLVQTRAAGRHRLVRRFAADAAEDLLARFEPGSPVAQAELVAEDPAGIVLEELLAIQRPRLDREMVLASWQVDLSGESPRLARLAVPPDVLAEAGGDLRRLVLVSSGKILPAMRGDVFGEPAAAERRVEPTRLEDDPRRAEAQVELGVPAGAVRELELIAARRAFDLTAVVLAKRPTPPGARAAGPARAAGSWSCEAGDEPPVCAAHVPLGAGFPWSTRRVRIVFELEDGSLPPSVRLRAWREDPVLLFAPPGRDDLRLVLLDRRVPGALRDGPTHAFDVAAVRVDPSSRRTPLPAWPKGLALFAALLVVGAIVTWIVLRNLPARRG